MKILVTGGSGFVGSFLVPRLKELGHDVYQFEQYFFKSIGQIDLRRNQTFLGDITDALRVRNVIKEIQPEVIIHLAAQTSVAISYENPLGYLYTNLVGTFLISECARLELGRKLKQFIHASTAEVYGITKKVIKEETDRLPDPNSPYAWTKLSDEAWLNHLYKARGFPITIIRPFNSYGRIDSHYFVVEKTIYQMLTRNNCKLGDSDGVRDFVHIGDHVNAYIVALNNPKAIGETFNMATGKAVSIFQLAQTIKRLTNFNGTIVWGTMPKRPMDIGVLIGSNKKIRKTLGWPKPLSLDKGLERTVEAWREQIFEQS